MRVADSQSECTSVRHREARPPPCATCATAAWWNGWRRVFVVVATEGGTQRVERWIGRAKCPACRHGFTVYPADQYPHRQYQLDVVATVAAAVALGGETPKTAATRASSSVTSARRWTAWLAKLADPALLLSAAQKLDSEAPAGEGISATAWGSNVRAGAARVLAALEQLGVALVRRGVAVISRTGLGRVLEWQLRCHGDVVHLVAEPRRLSPAMALGVSGSGL